ncbi:MAG: OmpA family protein [Novosphingobium sp.]|jgi:outer membrane protein OmpA-like peptidoglycan-associated protein
MRILSHRVARLALVTMIAAPLPAGLAAQQAAGEPNIVVEGQPILDPATMAKGPEVKGVISARSGDRIRVTSPDGSSAIITVNETTKIRSGGGLFGGSRTQLGRDALLNGLPVTVKTLQAGETLLASQVSFKSGDYKTASMIRTGTAQQFAEQTAATEALRGRMADIDKYNIKGTTNVYFDTGKWALSPQAKVELCATAAQAEATNNALMLVVGYTDSDGSDEFNQALSEKRASAVINYLQQDCRWKPYRMLTPTGMAESDPAADNSTPEGKAQNRRVAVNVLVSKSIDGI